MSTAILATKLYIPPHRPQLVLRPRLIDQLNAGLSSGHKLTLISAPAGFGKTTLVSEWIAGYDRPTAWLSLDEDDSDLTHFLTYLITALQTIVPNMGADVVARLQSPQSPPVQVILTSLLNEIAAIRDNFIFVLDDYHMLDSKPIDNALAFLVEHQPPQMHLIITTREDPNLPLARLRVRSQLTELRAADLRFTASEAAEFLNQAMGLNLSAKDISALEVRTEGWIAGLQLAAISMKGHADSASFIKSFTGSHHFVLDYLVEEVLQQQPENIQNFLLYTSILDRMCGPLCDAILLESSAQETLEYLERSNLFIIPLDPERRWYRYHHLFGSLLRQRQGQNLTPEEIAKYHLRASEWYEGNDQATDAFQHAIAAQDFERAARLAEKYWQRMDESFQPVAWLGWVKQLPEDLIRSRPVLCTQIAWALMDLGEIDASESRLRDAERCLENMSDDMVIVDEAQFRILPARIAFVRTYNAQTQSDFASTVKYAQLVIKLAPTQEDYFLRAQATAILGSAYWANGELEAACNSLSDWIDSSQRAGNFIFAIASAPGKADILTVQGYLREAIRTYQQALQLASEHENESQRIAAHHHLGLAMLYHEMGEDETSAQHIKKSFALGEQSTLLDWPYRKCLAQARLKESDGDLTAALELLDEARRVYVRSLIPNTRPVDAVKTRIYLKQGLLPKAEEWVREQSLSIDDELSYLREFEHITLARVLTAEYLGRHEKHIIHNALTLLECLLKKAEEGKRAGSVLEILITTTLAYDAQGSTSQAFTSLERALNLAQSEGYFRIFLNEGEALRSLLSDFKRSLEKQSHGGEPKVAGYVNKLLSAFPKPADIPRSNLTELLSQRELEVLRLIAQGLSNDEISQRLFLALDTVKGHNRRIYNKLQVQRRTEAINRARELGLL